MEIIDKPVDFSKCKTCKHLTTKEYDEPCHECLNTFTMPYSRTPINYEYDETSANTRSKHAKQS